MSVRWLFVDGEKRGGGVLVSILRVSLQKKISGSGLPKPGGGSLIGAYEASINGVIRLLRKLTLTETHASPLTNLCFSPASPVACARSALSSARCDDLRPLSLLLTPRKERQRYFTDLPVTRPGMLRPLDSRRQSGKTP